MMIENMFKEYKPVSKTKVDNSLPIPASIIYLEIKKTRNGILYILDDKWSPQQDSTEFGETSKLDKN